MNTSKKTRNPVCKLFIILYVFNCIHYGQGFENLIYKKLPDILKVIMFLYLEGKISVKRKNETNQGAG